MILGWSGDRTSGTWMFGFPSPASSWLKEEHLVSISTASLILLSRELSWKSIILTRFSWAFPIKSSLIQAKSSNFKNYFICNATIVNSAQPQRWFREEKIQKASGNLISKTNTLNCSTNFVKLDCFINSDCHAFDVVGNTHTEAHLIQRNIHIQACLKHETTFLNGKNSLFFCNVQLLFLYLLWTG